MAIHAQRGYIRTAGVFLRRFVKVMKSRSTNVQDLTLALCFVKEALGDRDRIGGIVADLD
ncbi:MAG: hypothetical protein ACI9DC_005506 [Gammaproteobacteria bacterium]|jgi:hypothetical protein